MSAVTPTYDYSCRSIPGSVNQSFLAGWKISRVLVQECRQCKTLDESPGLGIGRDRAEAFSETGHATTIVRPLIGRLRPDCFVADGNKGVRRIGLPDKQDEFAMRR